MDRNHAYGGAGSRLPMRRGTVLPVVTGGQVALEKEGAQEQ